MNTTRCTRTIGAPVADLWSVVSDPHHLPRWWPRVERVESVEGDAFTEVLKTAKGKLVRADFSVVELDEISRRLRWCQQIEDSPFARLLESAETEVQLESDGSGTEVTIELRQELARGRVGSWFHPRLGSHMVQRAATSTLEEALDGLQRIGAGAPAAGSIGSPGNEQDPSHETGSES